MNNNQQNSKISTDFAGAISVLPEDVSYMRRALTLAKRGRGRTHPNPMVGAVLVREGKIVGEGWHQHIGAGHAETMAFADAGEAARGATLYVTLEPCSFFFSSTGAPRLPCSERCIRAGVARVVCAMADPDVRVSGEGFQQLQSGGIAVTVGVEEAVARSLNAPYIRQRTHGLPFITHKTAMTLDGKISAPDGSAKWITGDIARRYVHRLRHFSDALIVGVGTILADDPELTTRLPSGNGQDPLRVILDSSLRTPPTARVARSGTLLFTVAGSNEKQQQTLKSTGAEVLEVPPDEAGRVDVALAMRVLADRGKYAVLLESGGTLAAAFYRANLVNRLLFFMAPKIIGGNGATPIDGTGIALQMVGARGTGPLKIRRFGQDIAIEAELGDIVVE